MRMRRERGGAGKKGSAQRSARGGWIVSFPDPFCARARNLKLGGGERPGKVSGKSSRPSTGNGRNAGAVRMECS